MESRTGNLIIRKLTTTFVATTIFSLVLVFFSIIDGFELPYNKGNQFIGWFFIYLMYIGVIILIYGNLVSTLIEYMQRKWFRQYDWLYVFILGVFGLANGLLFPSVTFALLGMVAAILYAIIDKWLYRRHLSSKNIKMFFLIPIACVVLCWGYFQLTSPPMPPFTKEDAVHFATSGQGTVIEHFPKEIGIWEGTIEGYEVKRETNVKEIEDEIYIVSFTENWKKGTERGTWELSYKIERGSLTANGEKGSIPPYYKGD
ncbi:hypothetical protein [Bacillus sp. Marseille-P3661]|uniref:hypothetical protein n=1 Tax=Bacillus sp. Marseille-P3661 TaxID=1936234 RepID=UPI000C836471|nr:hypothetical protein [Bacillus sp. Marseille-P3661]